MPALRKLMLYILGGGAALIVAAVLVWVYVVQNVEQPPYDVLAVDGPIERRAYPALIAAEVAAEGPRRDAVRDGFRALAGYIFASDREGDKIAMTAPVIQRVEGAGRWGVQFIMPSAYDLDDLPAPASDRVRLEVEPAAERAAIRFSGVANDTSIAENEARLRDWIAANGLRPAGPPLYAYYNDPFTPGFLRRNEVLIAVVEENG
jgi:hypothetical protein